MAIHWHWPQATGASPAFTHLQPICRVNTLLATHNGSVMRVLLPHPVLPALFPHPTTSVPLTTSHCAG